MSIHQPKNKQNPRHRQDAFLWDQYQTFFMYSLLLSTSILLASGSGADVSMAIAAKLDEISSK